VKGLFLTNGVFIKFMVHLLIVVYGDGTWAGVRVRGSIHGWGNPFVRRFGGGVARGLFEGFYAVIYSVKF
jgi:hypothetical protein